MRILHLGYEDPAKPGSGGGAVRTREINRRLSSRHEITVVVAGYPGAKPRVEDGVRWVPLWPRSGQMIDRLAYFALLGPAVRKYPHDLIVEDFSAPFSTGFSPWFTDRPVVASVQWLFASEMKDKYHLPFDLIENRGLALYKNFIVISEWLAMKTQARRPGARVSIIPEGVDPIAFSVQPAAPRHLLFVGRLDLHQKGCDFLPEIIQIASQSLGNRMPPLFIAGDGPDRTILEKRVHQAGLAEIIRFCGRIDGKAKYQLMADSYAVLMPSRYETFGMVAAESQAAGAPLVAFDVGPLREVAGKGGASLIQPFDVNAFAEEVVRIVLDDEKGRAVRETGRQWARKYDWDAIARDQEAVYLQAVQANQSAGSSEPTR